MFISFERKHSILFSCVVLVILMCPRSSIGYGYKRNEDPIITIFKSAIFYGRKDDWVRVEADINTISDRIDDVQNLFEVDLRPQLEAGISQHNIQKVIKAMANLVFLAIREKFYWNLTENLRMFSRANVRLRLAEEYYTLLLSGNVRRYDSLNGTKLHAELFNEFVEARKTLGSMGFLGAGGVSPRPDGFLVITKGIEQKLLLAFPYFKSGKEIIY